MVRKGMMIGKGSGYKNVIGKDPKVHSQSAQGIKQPQRVNIPITPYLKGWETPLSQDRPTIKVDLDEFKKINKDDITTSDLQGIAMGYGIKYIGSKNIQGVNEIEDIFLQYANGDMDINTAKRYIEETIYQDREKDKIKGGLGDNKPDSDFDQKELKKGIKVEMEHTNNPEIAEEISKDHLSESKNYYKELAKMEKKLEKENKNPIIEKRYEVWEGNILRASQTSKESAEKYMGKGRTMKIKYWKYPNPRPDVVDPQIAYNKENLKIIRQRHKDEDSFDKEFGLKPLNKPKKVLKTKIEFAVQGHYGSRWEDVTSEDKRSEARARLKEYNENERQYPHRLITRRIKNPEYKGN